MLEFLNRFETPFFYFKSSGCFTTSSKFLTNVISLSVFKKLLFTFPSSSYSLHCFLSFQHNKTRSPVRSISFAQLSSRYCSELREGRVDRYQREGCSCAGPRRQRARDHLQHKASFFVSRCLPKSPQK